VFFVPFVDKPFLAVRDGTFSPDALQNVLTGWVTQSGAYALESDGQTGAALRVGETDAAAPSDMGSTETAAQPREEVRPGRPAGGGLAEPVLVGEPHDDERAATTFAAGIAPRTVVQDSPAVNRSVTHLTEELLHSYARVGGINHLDGKNLPSKTTVARLTCQLLQLLFPGFFEEKPLHSSELKIETATRLDTVAGDLEDEIYKALEYNPPPATERRNLRQLSRDNTMQFLGELPRLRELLQTDTEAAFNGDPAALSKEEIIVAYPFMEAIAVQRMAHQLYLQGVPLIPRIMTEWAHARSGMDIHPGATIGTHFFVDHCTGTVIGETALIGNHVKLYQGVGLVARSLAAGQALKGLKRHPTLEDRVTIYANATIVGGDTVIGAGSTIGASVFLMNSVPANSLVVTGEHNLKVFSKAERDAAPVDFQI
jgi:serine O-acetyltransferase